MKTIFHIGHHKTGTTALQSFLSNNHRKLLAAGVLYPWILPQNTISAGLAQAISLSGLRDLPIGLREPHNGLAFKMMSEVNAKWKVPAYYGKLPHSSEILSYIKSLINKKDPEKVVICSEVMSHFGKTHPGSIDIIHRELAAPGGDVMLWCVLRRPDHQAESWHGQQIRFGRTPPPLFDPRRGVSLASLHFDYRGVLQPWISRLTKPELSIQPYSDVLRAGGAINAFTSSLSIRIKASSSHRSAENRSRAPAVNSILREANRNLPRPVARRLGKALDKISTEVHLEPRHRVELIGPRSRQRMFRSFLPIHEWLSQTSGRTSFFSDVDDILDCRPIPEADAVSQFLDQLNPALIRLIPDASARSFLDKVRPQGAEFYAA